MSMSYDLSKELFHRALKVAPGGVHSPVRSFKGMDRAPQFFKHAEGAWLTSVENQKYIDFCLSFGPLILGHQDPDVKEAVLKQVHTAWTFGACEPYSLELAEWITQHIPWVEKLRFVSSGTEAVMSALRVARAFTGRKKVLKFEGCYHGHLDSLLVQAGSGLAGESASSSAGVPPEVAQFTLVCPLNDIEAFKHIMSIHGSDICAVAIEPLPANYGLLQQTDEFLLEVAKVTRQHGALLLWDEVISGFRVALGGMAAQMNVQPDLVCYGKIIGGGFPVGCYGGRQEIMDFIAPLGPVYQAGTLSANPIGMVAGLTSLKKMQAVDIWNQLEKRTSTFVHTLQKGFVQLNLPLQIVQYGSLFWIHEQTAEPIRSIEQIPKTQSSSFKKLFLNALQEGVYLAPNAYEVGFTSWAHSEELLAEAAEKLLLAAEKTLRV